MQRLAILVLCAAVGVATVWMLARTGESIDGRERGGGSGAASAPAAAGTLAASPSGAQPRAVLEGSGERSRNAGGFAAQSGVTDAATRAEPSGSTDSDLDAARSSETSRAQRAEADDDARITPEDAERWARSMAPSEPEAAVDGESAEFLPSESDAEPVYGDVLSQEVIDERVNRTLKDGSMPPDQLEIARELERARLLRLSQLANSLAAKPKELEAAPETARIVPQSPLPPPKILPAPPPEKRQVWTGSSSSTPPPRPVVSPPPE